MRVERYWWFYDGARVLLEQRRVAARWGGLWTLPALESDSPSGLATFVSLRHHIMRFLVDLQVVRGDHAGMPQPQAASRIWHPVAALGEIPMPTPHRRVIGLALAAESARL